MNILVTGSAGHLGEGLIRVLRERADTRVIGIDVKHSPFTSHVGDITDAEFVDDCMTDIDAVYHTATLHKPHVATHSKAEFVATNITGTLTLLEAAVACGVRRFVFTSTTSTFGDALRPEPGQPAAWVTEATTPIPKNIYGVTKIAAEELCQLFERKHGLSCVVLRTSRFFSGVDDNALVRSQFNDANAKVNEFLYRRVDLQDVVDAHLIAADRATDIGFGRYIISATTPLTPDDVADLNTDAASVVRARVAGFDAAYRRLGWHMFERIDRVYSNEAARRDLGWQPAIDFGHALELSLAGETPQSPLARAVGDKAYHDESFERGPYPVEE